MVHKWKSTITIPILWIMITAQSCTEHERLKEWNWKCIYLHVSPVNQACMWIYYLSCLPLGTWGTEAELVNKVEMMQPITKDYTIQERQDEENSGLTKTILSLLWEAFKIAVQLLSRLKYLINNQMDCYFSTDFQCSQITYPEMKRIT